MISSHINGIPALISAIRSKRTAEGTTYELCFKGEGKLAREEIVMPLTEEQFEQLRSLVKGPLIRKDYRVYALPDGKKLECSLVDEGEATSFLYAAPYSAPKAFARSSEREYAPANCSRGTSAATVRKFRVIVLVPITAKRITIILPVSRRGYGASSCQTCAVRKARGVQPTGMGRDGDGGAGGRCGQAEQCRHRVNAVYADIHQRAVRQLRLLSARRHTGGYRCADGGE